MSVTAAEAVRRLSLALGEAYILIGSLTGGETGATAVRGPRGVRVLKWELDPGNQLRRREGAALAERLRTDARWPVPMQQVVEHDAWLFVLQEFMAGDAVTAFSHSIVDDLFDLHERRVGLARVDDSHRWADDLVETLVVGGNGYCLHEPLRTHDNRTRRVVERIEEIGRSVRPEDLDGRDVVHGDLHPGNMLQSDGRLAAIVDLDYTKVGDAAFDLATLAVASLTVEVDRGVRSRLFERGIESLPEPRRSAYVAHLLLRLLDWPIRKHRPAEVEFWLARADELLTP